MEGREHTFVPKLIQGMLNTPFIRDEIVLEGGGWLGPSERLAQLFLPPSLRHRPWPRGCLPRLPPSAPPYFRRNRVFASSPRDIGLRLGQRGRGRPCDATPCACYQVAVSPGL